MALRVSEAFDVRDLSSNPSGCSTWLVHFEFIWIYNIAHTSDDNTETPKKARSFSPNSINFERPQVSK